MAITYVAGSKSPTVFNTVNTVPAIASAASGDILLAFCSTTDSGSGDSAVSRSTPPDGTWTRIAKYAILTSRTRVEVYAKTATGPMAQSVFTWATSHWTATFVVAYRGAILPTTGLATGSQTTFVDTPAQTVSAGDLVVVSAWSSQFTADFGANVTKRLTDYVSPRSYVVGDLSTGASERFTATGTSAEVASSVLLKPFVSSRPASVMYVKDGAGYKPTTLHRKYP